MEPLYISISGLIGAGKTTLAEALSVKMSIPVYHEPVIDNEYLADFYKDKKTYAYPLQIYLLNKRFKQQQEIIWSGKGAIQDRSIYEDAVFAQMLRDEGFINPRDYNTYLSLSSSLFNFMKRPDFIIYLDITPEESLERIKTRDRECEHSLELSYLEKLHRYYKGWLNEISKKIPILMLKYHTFKPVNEVVNIINEWYQTKSSMFIAM